MVFHCIGLVILDHYELQYATVFACIDISCVFVLLALFFFFELLIVYIL